ncbi:connector enhancer of kinase suppressor of ras 1 [Tachyglossus aculeatus]|uniref:connector enhancer of kinase suppressor of ras 1 n=1 Tax=Tachyglossus aculeatus TaxID=9261 RepID=UPI0018F656C6|nr:connector enhancer of kinase suppressor of ras 1 [Tachyglossus aculeatus]
MEAVSGWTPSTVAKWLRGLDESVQGYPFEQWPLTGQTLLQLTYRDLETLGVHRVGHQELILEGVEHLYALSSSLETENLKSLATHLREVTHALQGLVQSSGEGSVGMLPPAILSCVVELVQSAWELFSWLKRYLFSQLNDYSACQEIVGLCAQLEQTLQEDSPEAEKESRILTIGLHGAGIEIHSTSGGRHFVSGTGPEFLVGDHWSQLLPGDEIIQVNGQVVVGWTQSNLKWKLLEDPAHAHLLLKNVPVPGPETPACCLSPGPSSRSPSPGPEPLARSPSPGPEPLARSPSPGSVLSARSPSPGPGPPALSPSPEPPTHSLSPGSESPARSPSPKPPLCSHSPSCEPPARSPSLSPRSPALSLSPGPEPPASSPDPELPALPASPLPWPPSCSPSPELIARSPSPDPGPPSCSLSPGPGTQTAVSPPASPTPRVFIFDQCPSPEDPIFSGADPSPPPEPGAWLFDTGVYRPDPEAKTPASSRRKPKGVATRLSRRRVSCRDLGRADCDGWLLRKKDHAGFMAQKWRRCWVVLKGHTLYWYSHPQDEKAEGLINVSNYSLESRQEQKKKYVFQLTHEVYKPFVFAADTLDDLSMWVSHLVTSISKYQAPNRAAPQNEEDCYSETEAEDPDEEIRSSADSPSSGRARHLPRDDSPPALRTPQGSPGPGHRRRGSPGSSRTWSVDSSDGAMAALVQGLRQGGVSLIGQPQPVTHEQYRSSFVRRNRDPHVNERVHHVRALQSTLKAKLCELQVLDQVLQDPALTGEKFRRWKLQHQELYAEGPGGWVPAGPEAGSPSNPSPAAP